MAFNFQELTKCVEHEFDKLIRVDKNNKIAHDMDTTVQDSACLLQPASNKTKSVIIQMQIDKTFMTPPVSSTSRIRFPIAITIISLLQIVLYVYDSMHRRDNHFSPLARILLFSTADRCEIWRFFTYMFVHLDQFHLGVNIFFQLLGGVPLEISHGWWRVTIVYLAGVLGGSLGVEAISNCNALVGASAGVYSILGAHFSTLILNWKETEDRIVRVFILLVYVLTDLFNWMCIPQIVGNPEFGSATCALVSEITNTTITHFCGFMIGMLTAIVILKNHKVRAWERKAQIISLLLLVFIISLAICLVIFVPTFNVKSLIENLECDKAIVKVVVKD